MKIYNVILLSYDMHGDAEASIVSSVSYRDSAIKILELEANDLLSEVEDVNVSEYFTSEDHSSLEYDWEDNGFKLFIQETDLDLPKADAIWMIDYEWHTRESDRGHKTSAPYHDYIEAYTAYAKMKAQMITEFASLHECDSYLHEDTTYHCLIGTKECDEWEEITMRQL